MFKDKCKILYKFRGTDKYLVVPKDGYLVNGKCIDECDASAINITKIDGNPYHDPATGRFTSKDKSGISAAQRGKVISLIKEKKVPLFGVAPYAKEIGMSDDEYNALKKEHFPKPTPKASKTVKKNPPQAKELTEEQKAKVAEIKAEEKRKVNTIASECKVSEAEAVEYHKTLDDWMGRSYDGIRAAQSGRTKGFDDTREIDAQSMAEYKRQAVLIEKYIEAAPKYKGEVYRGISVDSMPFKKGMVMDMAGTSSWSASPRVARGFCNNGFGRKHSVVFRAKDVSKSTELDHIYKAGEHEVIVSKDVKFRVANVTTEESSLGIGRKITYVDLEEVS